MRHFSRLAINNSAILTVHELRRKVIMAASNVSGASKPQLAKELKFLFDIIKHPEANKQAVEKYIDRSNIADEIKLLLKDFRNNGYTIEALRDLTADSQKLIDELSGIFEEQPEPQPQPQDVRFDLETQGHTIFENNFDSYYSDEISNNRLPLHISLISFKGESMFVHLDKIYADEEGGDIAMPELIIVERENWLSVFNVLCGYSSPSEEYRKLGGYANADLNAHYLLHSSPGHPDFRSKLKRRIIDEKLESDLVSHMGIKPGAIMPYQEPARFISPFDELVPMILQGMMHSIEEAQREISVPKTHPNSSAHISLTCNIINRALQKCGIAEQINGYSSTEKRQVYFFNLLPKQFPYKEILEKVKNFQDVLQTGFKRRGNKFIKIVNDENDRNFYRAFAALYHDEENFCLEGNMLVIQSEAAFHDFLKKVSGNEYAPKRQNLLLDEQHDGSHFRTSFASAIENDDELAVIKYLSEGFDVNMKMLDKNYPLQVAACNGYVNIGRLLVNKGAKINNPNFQTGLLFVATQHNRSKFLEFLLDEAQISAHITIDINAKNPQGLTALHLAVRHGHVEVMEKLLQHNADTQIKSDDFKKNIFEEIVQSKLKPEVKNKMLDSLMKYSSKEESKEYFKQNGTQKPSGDITAKTKKPILVSDGKVYF